MTTKDALHYTRALLDEFPENKYKKVFANSFIQFEDKKNAGNLITELLIQAFDHEQKETNYIAHYMRAKNFSCSNGVRFIAIAEKENFRTELLIHKRIKEIF
jgi:hypothetical protein